MIHVTLMPHVPTQEAATLVSVSLDTLEVGKIAQVCFCVSYYANTFLRLFFKILMSVMMQLMPVMAMQPAVIQRVATSVLVTMATLVMDTHVKVSYC